MRLYCIIKKAFHSEITLRDNQLHVIGVVLVFLETIYIGRPSLSRGCKINSSINYWLGISYTNIQHVERK